MLKMGIAELQRFVQAQCEENPALTLEDAAPCPFCGVLMTDGTCAVCARDNASSGQGNPWDEPPFLRRLSDEADEEEALEPLALVAAPVSLQDYVKSQLRAEFPEQEVAAAELIIDHVDDDGYLREPLLDLACKAGLSVPQLEAVLAKVQRLDPPGVGCRDLREFLLLQMSNMSERNAQGYLAERMVQECWDSLSRMKLKSIARDLRTDVQAVREAIDWMRRNLSPYPAGAFRDPWHTLTPRRVPNAPPDVVVRATESGLVAEVVDPLARALKIDEVYETIARDVRRRAAENCADECAERLTESVEKARTLLEALEFRRASLRRITQELIRCQEAFFTNGPLALRPMTRKQLARKLGLHESTVSRATQNKSLRLPSGEIVSFDVLFDPALP
ncbi:MAG: hypothetical protein ACP5R5_11045, partial [Armatimonadota bacterium]